MATEYSDEHWRLRHQARYAQRLCERTARLYKRLQTFSTFASVIGGSAAITAASQWAPAWLPAAGAATLAVFGAITLAVRPGERAALCEEDVRKYAQLQLDGLTMDDAAFAAALDKASISDAPEVEPLRDVAYNDVVREVGRADLAGPLKASQRLLAVLA